MELNVFARTLGEAGRDIRLPAAHAANPLNAGKVAFALAQRQHRFLPIRYVTNRGPHAVSERKRSYLVIPTRMPNGISFEFLPRALGHHFSIAPLELSADDAGRDLPELLSDDVRARQAK